MAFYVLSGTALQMMGSHFSSVRPSAAHSVSATKLSRTMVTDAITRNIYHKVFFQNIEPDRLVTMIRGLIFPLFHLCVYFRNFWFSSPVGKIISNFMS